MKITPSLNGLPPGLHGFHVHEKSDCSPAADKGKQTAGMAAGGHLDPKHSGKHLGPGSTEGHSGDMPVLVVDDSGAAQKPMVAPHLTVDDVVGHSIMIHVVATTIPTSRHRLVEGGPASPAGSFRRLQVPRHERAAALRLGL